MDNSQPASQEILKEIVTQFGKQIFNKSESARLDGMLADYFAHDRKTLKLFRLAVKENIVHELLQCSSLGKAEQTIKIIKLKSHLQEEAFIDESFANEAVDSFAYALGITVRPHVDPLEKLPGQKPVSKEYRTPLILAAKEGYTDFVTVLINAGADLEIKESYVEF